MTAEPRRPRTILLVDANATLTTLLEKYLRREGFDTAVVATGADGLTWLTRRVADLMLLDLDLPDTTGEAVVTALTARSQTVPFVVLSGHGRERGAAEMMKRGALDYLMKDGTILELLPTVVKQAFDRIDRQSRLGLAERELERLRRHHESILNAAGEGIIGLDERVRVTFVNPAGLRLLGYAPGELLGHDLGTLAEPPGADSSRESLTAGHTLRGHDLQFYRKDGTPFPIEYTSTPIREGGRQTGAVFVFKDISQRRALEDQVRQSQKLEAVGRLAGGVAHDFNNLLTVIGGYTDLLSTNASLNERGREAVAEVRRAADRAVTLTRQLLAFGSKQVLQPRRFDPNAVVADAQKMLKRLIGEHIRLETEPGQGLGVVTADPGQFEQVILNLVVNARDAMPRGGTLTLSTAAAELTPSAAASRPGVKPGKYVVFAVADTGVGMDGPTQARVFEPFFTTKGPGRGTGLGLTTVYGIVQQSGGWIDLSSEPGRGTTFRVYLPRTDGVPEPRVVRPSGPQPPTRGAETVLLVEDEEAVRTLAARSLRLHGYKVVPAADGAEAEGVAGRGTVRPHILVTDVVMPGVSGVELARRLASVWPGMSVLFISGYADRKLVPPEALESVAFLQKPFSPDELARKVREVLDAGAGGARAS